MAKETVLIVDDEQDICELIAYNLEREGYSVATVTSGEDAISHTKKILPDIIVLDLMLPGIDGLGVCKQLKMNEATAEIPIIMLTAKTEDSDIISGLEVGADDYITKPFSPKVLIARIRAVLRRNRDEVKNEPPERITIHGIAMDIARHEVTSEGKPVNLSATEFSILEFLARNPGWVFSRNKIIDAVKGKDYPVTERSVDVQILGLRKKLGLQGEHIQTVRGVGYRMESPA
ncbi:MAG: response regulator [Spirochaetia bacterium]